MKQLYIAFTFLLTCTMLCAQNSQAIRGAHTFEMGTPANPEGKTILVDGQGVIVDGHPVIPVMGEMHYSRLPQQEWRRELKKMKAGGVTIVATYIFWIHHEDEQEGVWDWSGNRDLRRFVEICQEEGLMVVLRVGPWCHGEVYQGGLPCWLVTKSLSEEPAPNGKGLMKDYYKLRTTAPGFMEATAKLYNQIAAQVNGLLWKDGGPIVGVQLENESRGPWPYFQQLLALAHKAGLDVPIYTRTGWPQFSGHAEFGKILPLYGDYADGFWDRKLTDMPGDYKKAFIMKDTRLSAVIATEIFGDNQSTQMQKQDLSYPYLTCELGGGMCVSYHRRVNISGREAMPLCVCKLGSGSNLPGYYMYHGGTNPFNPLHTMGETLNSRYTAGNDVPVMSYDFQTILGEMGRPNPISWDETRWVHQFLADWGEELSSMKVDTMSANYARRGQFEFRNDYVRIVNEQGTASITPIGMQWEGLTITSTSLQPLAKADGGLYFIALPNTKKHTLTVNGKKYTVKPDATLTIQGKKLTVLSREKAQTAYVIDHHMVYGQGGILYLADGQIMEETWVTTKDAVDVRQLKQAGKPEARISGNNIAERQPDERTFEQEAAVYSLQVAQTDDDTFLEISYQGDCARLYANGQLVEDNFWNGKPMQVRASSLRGKEVELKILPLRKGTPIYLGPQQRAILDATEGDYLFSLDSIQVVRRITQYL